MKILLFGKSGMLGSCFLEVFERRPDLEVFAFSKDEVDITDPEQVVGAFEKVGEPDVVINCAAYTAVDDCETQQELATEVNAEAPANIAWYCKELGCKFVHFSTDYVFGGDEMKGYREDSEMEVPVNFYGRSKLAAEIAIMRSTDNFYIVRTAWLFGPNGRNFVDTMIKLGSERDELSVVGDQFGSPTYTVDLVEAVIANFVDGDKEPGIYHITNDESCSWYDFAEEIFRLKGIEIDLKRVTSAEFKRPAKRPKYSILLNTKLPKLRSWKDALKAYLGL